MLDLEIVNVVLDIYLHIGLLKKMSICEQQRHAQRDFLKPEGDREVIDICTCSTNFSESRCIPQQIAQ
jgi:hypothetical protein